MAKTRKEINKEYYQRRKTVALEKQGMRLIFEQKNGKITNEEWEKVYQNFLHKREQKEKDRKAIEAYYKSIGSSAKGVRKISDDGYIEERETEVNNYEPDYDDPNDTYFNEAGDETDRHGNLI